MSYAPLRKHTVPGYSILPWDTMQDARLTYRARGVLAYLLSKPDGWHVRSQSIAADSPGEGRDAVRSALRELAEHGYYRLARVRGDGGRVQMVTDVSPVPRPEWLTEDDTPQPPIPTGAGLPGPGEPGPDLPGPGKPGPFDKEQREKGTSYGSTTPPLRVVGADQPTLDGQPAPTNQPAKPKTARAKREPDPLELRANAVTDAVYEHDNGIRYPAVRGIARHHLKAGASDEQLVAAILRVIDEGRPISVETVRVALRGKRPQAAPRPSTDERVMGWLELGQQMQQNGNGSGYGQEQRAIEGGAL